MINLKLVFRGERHRQNSLNRLTSTYYQAKKFGERAEATFLQAIYKPNLITWTLMMER